MVLRFAVYSGNWIFQNAKSLAVERIYLLHENLSKKTNYGLFGSGLFHTNYDADATERKKI